MRKVGVVGHNTVYLSGCSLFKLGTLLKKLLLGEQTIFKIRLTLRREAHSPNKGNEVCLNWSLIT